MAQVISWITALNFTNLAIRSLPIEQKSALSNKFHYPRQVRNAVFSKARPDPNFNSPELIAVSLPALGLLNQSAENFSLQQYRHDDQFLEVFSGRKLLPTFEPHSHCYCGHQFGAFSGQLGDGTNVYLGDFYNNRTDVQNRLELQLKGSGKTAYSRKGDGRKVLRSSVREFLCSEYLWALGVPTTRAATLVASFDPSDAVQRFDQSRVFNGGQTSELIFRQQTQHPALKHEPIAIVSRIAPTFLRFGSFEVVKSQKCPVTGLFSNNPGNWRLLKSLTDYAITNFFKTKIHDTNDLQLFLNHVTVSTAQLVARWRAIGFCHGVLNTDNMSIIGLTIDLGPFGFMDFYDEDYVCNYSDSYGRYSFGNQKSVSLWNLGKLAEALNDGRSPDSREHGEEFVVDEGLYERVYDHEVRRLFKEKLGLEKLPTKRLLKRLFSAMAATRADFSSVFLLLEKFDSESEIASLSRELATICQTPASIRNRLVPIMKNFEFKNVFTKHVEQNVDLQTLVGLIDARDAEKQVRRVLRMRYLANLNAEEKLERDKKIWLKFLKYFQSVAKVGDVKNPRAVLRNHLAQEAIMAAENGDFSVVNQLLERLLDPFSGKSELLRGLVNDGIVPVWAEQISVSCSS